MEHEFKVGDWVTKREGFSSKESYFGETQGGAGFDNYPKTFQIAKITDAGAFKYAKKVVWKDHLPSTSGVFTHSIRLALPHEIPGNQQKQKEINLQVGDTFRNSVGNKKEIVGIRGWEYIIEDCDTYKRSYGIMRFEIENHIKSGFYTDYTPVSQQKIMKQWKKEDFYNTKIVVDTLEKSRRFQELMFSLDIKWFTGGKKVSYLESIYLSINNYGNLYHFLGNKVNDFINNTNKEIFYNEIFNENNNQLNNNQNGNKENNNNDVLGKNFSGNGSKETATAISFRRTSKIATSSGYTGNQIKGRRVDTKIGRSEISFSAISI